MSYKNTLLVIAVSLVFTAPVAALAADSGVVDSNSTVGGSTIGTVDSNSTVGGSDVGTVDSNSTVGGSTIGTVDSNSTVGGSTIGTVDSNSTVGAGSTVTNSGGSTVAQTGGTLSYTSSGGSSGGYVTPVTVATTSVPVISSASCPLISSYMKIGGTNDSADVAKLQAFLKNDEQINVAVTGTFDAQTEAAVEAFQNKYLSDVMGPWGATKASGMVYITTMKKVNELACSQPLTLSASDLAIINAYKANAIASTDVQTTTATQSPSTVSPVIGSAPMVGPTANTAAVGNASVAGRFWNFLKNLF